MNPHMGKVDNYSRDNLKSDAGVPTLGELKIVPLDNYSCHHILYTILLTTGCSPSILKKVASDAKAVQSPFYPDAYTNNQECKWLMTAPPDMVVMFIIAKFDLGQGDFLEIRDGSDERAAMLKNLTLEQTVTGKMIKSTGRFLFVRFKSDFKNVGRGFRMLLFTRSKTFGKSIIVLTTGKFSHVASHLIYSGDFQQIMFSFL